MQVNNNINSSQLDNTLLNAKEQFEGIQNVPSSNSNKDEEKTLTQEMENAAVRVALSMNAQIVLYSMDASDLSQGNSVAQGMIFDFLSGKSIEGTFSLKDLGYEGKPITQLSEGEAKELIGEEGFFGIDETSSRVANFVLDFSGDDLELLEKGRAGIVQGFEEAEMLWGGVLPEISYETQSKTLELIDAKINSLKDNKED